MTCGEGAHILCAWPQTSSRPKGSEGASVAEIRAGKHRNLCAVLRRIAETRNVYSITVIRPIRLRKTMQDLASPSKCRGHGVDSRDRGGRTHTSLPCSRPTRPRSRGHPAPAASGSPR
eukprot:15359242-Heterocapsa_arctica.AAC.1